MKEINLLFLFIIFFLFHNNNGGFMKKFLLFFLLFMYDIVYASNVYISKKDLDTGMYLSDCDFVIFDSNGIVVDEWIQGDSFHVSKLSKGSYKLVSRPYVMNKFDDDLSVFYDLNVEDNDLFFTFYNDMILTPPNLKYNSSSFYFGLFFVFFGIFTLVMGKFFAF